MAGRARRRQSFWRPLCALNVDVRLTPAFGSQDGMALLSSLAAEADAAWPGTPATGIEVATSWPPTTRPARPCSQPPDHRTTATTVHLGCARWSLVRFGLLGQPSGGYRCRAIA